MLHLKANGEKLIPERHAPECFLGTVCNDAHVLRLVEVLGSLPIGRFAALSRSLDEEDGFPSVPHIQWEAQFPHLRHE